MLRIMIAVMQFSNRYPEYAILCDSHVLQVYNITLRPLREYHIPLFEKLEPKIKTFKFMEVEMIKDLFRKLHNGRTVGSDDIAADNSVFLYIMRMSLIVRCNLSQVVLSVVGGVPDLIQISVLC